tara:strand:- start:2224 stop:2502 length:279 start_codon:yes stop_codon:yes gene_type:complete
MLSKVFGSISISIATICIVLLTLFTNLTTAIAVYEGDNGDNPLQIVIEPSETNENIENDNTKIEMKMSEYPDLGSEQVFPFEAGFGKNSGKS